MILIICLSFEEDDDRTETVASLSVNTTIRQLVKILDPRRESKKNSEKLQKGNVS